MITLLTICSALGAFALATVRPRRKIVILSTIAFFVVVANIYTNRLTFEDICGYVKLPILALIIWLEIFSIVAKDAKLLDYLGVQLLNLLRFRERGRREALSWFKKKKRELFKYLISKVGEDNFLQVSLLGLTFLCSMFMNNLLTILIIVPLTIKIMDALGIEDADVERLLIFEVIVSNLGGAVMLIGDFPNMIIASESGANFLDFFLNLGILIIIALLPFTLIFFLILTRRKGVVQLTPDQEMRRRIHIRPIIRSAQGLVRREAFMVTALFIAMIICFIIFRKGNPALVAMPFAIIMLIAKREEELLNRIELKILIFFASLFILAGVVSSLGFMSVLKTKITAAPLWLSIPLLMWIVAVFTAILSAGPSTACFAPFAESMTAVGGGNLAWWALSLGVLAGSSASVMGATAGPIAAELFDKHGYEEGRIRRFSFIRFLKFGVFVMVVYLVISTIYMCIRIKMAQYN